MSGRRLDAVLRVRALREQLARSEVARQRGVLSAREDAAARAHAAIRRADRRDAVEAPLFLARRAMLAGGVRDANTAGAAAGMAREDLDAAAARWRETARRLDGVERLVERLTAEADVEERRRDAKELDDLVISRHTSENTRERIG